MVTNGREIMAHLLNNDQKTNLQGALLLNPDSLDCAIIGIARSESEEVVAVYSYEKLIDQLAVESADDSEDEADAYEQAAGWYSINIHPEVSSLGGRAPFIVFEEYDLANLAEDYPNGDAKTVTIAGRAYLRDV